MTDTIQPATRWEFANISDILTDITNGDNTTTQPTIGDLGDGHHLFYPGRVNCIAGESGDGKTFTALHTTLQEIHQHNKVVMIDYEDNPHGILKRLLDMGATPENIQKHFAYIHPDQAYDYETILYILHVIDEHQPTLVIIDSVGESLALQGYDQNADRDYAIWNSQLPALIANHGPCVLILDHLTKADATTRPNNYNTTALYASGSQRKRAAISGAMYIQKAVQPFSKGQQGQATLTCAKDKLGNRARGEKTATLHVTPHGDGHMTTTLAPSIDAPFKPTAIMEQISKWIEEQDGPVSQAGIERAIQAKATTIRMAVSFLHGDGNIKITAQGPGKANLITLIQPFRATTDDHPEPADNDTPDPFEEAYENLQEPLTDDTS